MLKSGASYLLTPKLSKLATDDSWAWLPCRIIYNVSICLTINLPWWTCLRCSRECVMLHALLLPYLNACFTEQPTWANGFGLSWQAHPQLYLQQPWQELPLQPLGYRCLEWPSKGNVGIFTYLIDWPCISRGALLKILSTVFDLNFFKAFKNELRFNTCFCPFLNCVHHELLN